MQVSTFLMLASSAIAAALVGYKYSVPLEPLRKLLRASSVLLGGDWRLATGPSASAMSPSSSERSSSSGSASGDRPKEAPPNTTKDVAAKAAGEEESDSDEQEASREEAEEEKEEEDEEEDPEEKEGAEQSEEGKAKEVKDPDSSDSSDEEKAKKEEARVRLVPAGRARSRSEKEQSKRSKSRKKASGFPSTASEMPDRSASKRKRPRFAGAGAYCEICALYFRVEVERLSFRFLAKAPQPGTSGAEARPLALQVGEKQEGSQQMVQIKEEGPVCQQAEEAEICGCRSARNKKDRNKRSRSRKKERSSRRKRHSSSKSHRKRSLSKTKATNKAVDGAQARAKPAAAPEAHKESTSATKPSGQTPALSAAEELRQALFGTAKPVPMEAPKPAPAPKISFGIPKKPQVMDWRRRSAPETKPLQQNSMVSVPGTEFAFRAHAGELAAAVAAAQALHNPRNREISRKIATLLEQCPPMTDEALTALRALPSDQVVQVLQTLASKRGEISDASVWVSHVVNRLAVAAFNTAQGVPVPSTMVTEMLNRHLPKLATAAKSLLLQIPEVDAIKIIQDHLTYRGDASDSVFQAATTHLQQGIAATSACNTVYPMAMDAFTMSSMGCGMMPMAMPGCFGAMMPGQMSPMAGCGMMGCTWGGAMPCATNDTTEEAGATAPAATAAAAAPAATAIEDTGDAQSATEEGTAFTQPTAEAVDAAASEGEETLPQEFVSSLAGVGARNAIRPKCKTLVYSHPRPLGAWPCEAMLGWLLLLVCTRISRMAEAGGTKEILKGISYGPAPLKAAGRLPNDDFMADSAKAQWSTSGRGDLAIMKKLGANAVRLYGNDPREDHKPFLDEAHSQGLQVIPGMSDYPFTQMPKNCITTEYNCYSQIKEQYKSNLENGFLDKDGSYHPALKTIIVINEPDLKIPGESQPKKFSRAIISAIDGMLDAEKEAGASGNFPNFTATFSFGVCTACPGSKSKPSLGQMLELRRAMEKPEDYGYTPKNDLAKIYKSRFTNSFNTNNPATDMKPLFLDDYEALFSTTPVFIGEYHAPHVPVGQDLEKILSIAQSSSLAPGLHRQSS
eukprot:s3126_g4.t2